MPSHTFITTRNISVHDYYIKHVKHNYKQKTLMGPPWSPPRGPPLDPPRSLPPTSVGLVPSLALLPDISTYPTDLAGPSSSGPSARALTPSACSATRGACTARASQRYPLAAIATHGGRHGALPWCSVSLDLSALVDPSAPPE